MRRGRRRARPGTYAARRADGGDWVERRRSRHQPTAASRARSACHRHHGPQAARSAQVRATNLAAIFEASPVAMLVCDQDVNVVRVNRATLRLDRRRAAEHLLHHRPESTRAVRRPPRLRQLLGGRGRLRHLIRRARCAPCATPCRPRWRVACRCAASSSRSTSSRDGEPADRWLRLGAEPMVMNGAPHVTVAVDDITDRRRAERALAESEERFRSLAERVPGFVSIKDSDHRYVYLNSLLGARIGGGEEVWLGKRPEEIWEPDEAAVSNATAEQGAERREGRRGHRAAPRRRDEALPRPALPDPARRRAAARGRADDRRQRSRWRPRRRCAARRRS